MVETLKTLMKKFKWDIPLAVYNKDGSLDYIGQSGMVYLSEDDGEPVIVFSGN